LINLHDNHNPTNLPIMRQKKQTHLPWSSPSLRDDMTTWAESSSK